jgi:hypothetical protein
MRSLPPGSIPMLLLIGACANTCGTQAKTASPSAPASASPAQAAPGATAASAVSESRPTWHPAPDSEVTQRLRAAQTEIERDRKFDGPASAAELSAVLPAQIGDFAADGEVAATEQHDSAAPFVAVARNYINGPLSARVKITDTAQLPSARRTLSSHLALIGNEAAGGEHGAFARDAPALLSHGDSYSRATALVGNRYLVQINTQGGTDPNAAQSLLEHLDWSALNPTPDN